MYADKDIDSETIKRYHFIPPSELDFTNVQVIDRLTEGANRVIHKLGQSKRKKEADLAAIDQDQEALRDYRTRIRLLTEGHKHVNPKKVAV